MMGLYDESTAESSNPKGELQIYSQALEKRLRPEYVLVSVEGKAHEPVFTVEVRLEGVGSAVAKDSTRKGAEAKAAAKLMSQIKGSNE
jgi:ribonuclease-3